MVALRLTVVLAAIGALVGATVVAPVEAAEHSVGQGSVRSVPEPGTDEPVEIVFTIYRPAGASATSPAPMVLHSHGWGGSRTNSPGAFDDFNDAGLAVLSFDQRGFGESSGAAHIEDPDFEGQDVQAIVDHVAGLDWVAKDPGTTDDPVLAAMGGSYGGGYQFVGAFTELRDRSDTRFDALAPEITWWDLSSSLAPSGVVRSAWVSALYAAGATALPQVVHEAFVYGSATGQWPDGTVHGNEVDAAPVPDIEAFFENNGPRWHVKQGRQLDIPVLFRQGTSDNLFNLNQGLANFQEAITPGARQESLFVGYNGGHALPKVVPVGTFDDSLASGGDACSAGLTGNGKGDFRQLSIEFFHRVFATGDGRPAGLPPYHLTTSGNGGCLRLSALGASQPVPLDVPLATPTGLAPPINVPVAEGPITVAGIPRLEATITSLGVDARAFFGLAVGTTPADARVVQNNLLPMAELEPMVQQGRQVTLPGVAVEVPESQSLFLTIAAWSDMYYGHGSRTPGGFVLEDVVVELPVVREVSSRG